MRKDYRFIIYSTYFDNCLIIFLQKGGIPVVTTADITGINQTSVTTGGTIVDDGGSEILQRCLLEYKRESNNCKTKGPIDGSGSGSFVSTPSQLMPKTYYTLRAYATNKAEQGYGEERSFLTGEIIIGSVDDFGVTLTKQFQWALRHGWRKT